MKRSLLILGFALAACNRDAPPAPSAEQTARLDEAEDMLNDMAGNGHGTAPEANPPANSN